MEVLNPDPQLADNSTSEPALSWSDLIRAYRLDRSESAAAALLERLGPWLANARRALLEAPPMAEAEDVAQQLVLEVLQIATRWEPHCEDRWIPRRLVERAERKVRNALRRERSRQPLELDEELAAPDEGETGLLLETPIGKASAADIRVIYRFHVLRVPLDAMAAEAGITPRQMRRRIQLAKQRARSW